MQSRRILATAQYQGKFFLDGKPESTSLSGRTLFLHYSPYFAYSNVISDFAILLKHGLASQLYDATMEEWWFLLQKYDFMNRKRANVLLLLLIAALILSSPVTIFADDSSDKEYADYIAEVQKKVSSATTARLHAADREKIALDVSGEEITVHGKVLLPDGSPAAGFAVQAVAVAFLYREIFVEWSESNPYEYTYSAVLDHKDVHNSTAQEDGTFQLYKVYAGANVALMIYAKDDDESENKRFVSNQIAFVAHEKMKPLEITLEEGIRLYGTIKYDDAVRYSDGTPAANRTLTIERQAIPVLGKDVPDLLKLLLNSRKIKTDAEGKYEIFLPIGTYMVYLDSFRGHMPRGSRKVTISKHRDTNEIRCDIMATTPIFIQLEREDGLPLGRLHGYGLARGSVYRTANESESKSLLITLDPVTYNQLFYVRDESNEVAAVETITTAMVGKTVQIKLKPMSYITVTLIDKEGKPIEGRYVSLSLMRNFPVFKDQISYPSVNAPNSTISSGSEESLGASVRTDAEGKVMLRVASGKVHVKVAVKTPYGGDAWTHYAEIDLAPGETLDLGTIQVR